MISVIIPLYNKEGTILEAINSVLNQTHQPFEIILINDGSSDKGADIVRNLNDSRIKIIDQKNAGVSAARNRGILEAKTDLIAFLDADDMWTDDFLATIIQLKSDYPKCCVFGTGYSYLDPDGSKRLPILNGIPRAPWHGVIDDYFYIASRSDPPLWTSATAVYKNAILSIGLFPEGVKSGEDLLTWARLAVKYSIAYNSASCAFFRVPANVSERPGRFDSKGDFVGDELVKLLEHTPKRFEKSLNNYIALWYTMRASIFIQLCRSKDALIEIWKAKKYTKNTRKLNILLIIACIPFGFSKNIYNLMRNIKKKSRIL